MNNRAADQDDDFVEKFHKKITSLDSQEEQQQRQEKKDTELDLLRRISRETAIWSRLHHPNILEMIEVIRLQDATVIICELAMGGTLLNYIQRFGHPALKEREALYFFKQIASALDYLHNQVGIIHHDIKLENILLTENYAVKIADFGLSLELLKPHQGVGNIVLPESDPHAHPPNCPGFCCSLKNNTAGPSETIHLSLPRFKIAQVGNAGSLHYLAPEDLAPPSSDQAHLALPKPFCDMWAAGCCLFALLTGSLPFNDSFLPRLQMQILNAKYDTAKLLGVSEQARGVVAGLLEKDTEKRWDVSRVLKSEWLSL